MVLRKTHSKFDVGVSARVLQIKIYYSKQCSGRGSGGNYLRIPIFFFQNYSALNLEKK